MRLFRQLWLLAGLMPCRSLAEDPTANMAIWDVDASCSNYHDGRTADTTGLTGGEDLTDYVQQLFTTALRVVLAAQQSLKFVLEKRPDEKTDPSGYNKWVRIADSLAVTLSIIPDPDKVESASDEFWAAAFKLYDKVVATLPASQNNPAHGYDPTLSKIPNAKPMIVCGDNWDWKGPDDYYPGSTKKLKDIALMEEDWKDGAVGAWYKTRRWIFKRKEKQKPIMCQKDDMGVSSADYNLIALCDEALKNDLIKTQFWVDPKRILEGFKISYPLRSTQSTLIHELLHWYSGVISAKDSSNAVIARRGSRSGTGSSSESEEELGFVLDDQNSVNEDGYLVYADADGNEVLKARPVTRREQIMEKLKIEQSYTVENIFNLARRHEGKETAGNTGPAKAIDNAESLTLFAIMMYYSDWNWAAEGKARKPGRVYNS